MLYQNIHDVSYVQLIRGRFFSCIFFGESGLGMGGMASGIGGTGSGMFSAVLESGMGKLSSTVTSVYSLLESFLPNKLTG